MTPVSFLHTSPAAIPPLMQYWGEHAPEFEITNQLDDGLLRMLSKGNLTGAEVRLGQMLATAKDQYGARAALVTCSAVTPAIIASLADSAGIPVLKIDNPMADEAVRACSRIGVVITFRPTLEPTTRLLEESARNAGRSVELKPVVITEAYQALLGGDPDMHDALLMAAIAEMTDIDGVVLAQVSMARLLPKLTGLTVPVFSSLPSSLKRIRELVA